MNKISEKIFPYEDIVNLPHHVSNKHPHMSALGRAAQFAPFAALNGHEDAINKTREIADAYDSIVHKTFESSI